VYLDLECAVDIVVARGKRRVESSVAGCKTRSGRKSQSEDFYAFESVCFKTLAKARAACFGHRSSWRSLLRGD
jgi:hypothetical protein